MNDTGEFRRGWPIVLASCVGIALGLSPIPFYEIGLFAPEIAKEFGWGIGTIMAGVFFMMCGSLLASPAVGYLADRYGARRVALTSIVCFGIFLSLFALQSGSLPLYYANWFLLALTGAGTLPITWTRAINQNFDLKKGLALGIALAGTGASGFLLKPATASVVAAHGWRAGFVFLSLMPILISLPLAALCFRQPASTPASAGRNMANPEGRTFGEAIRDYRFWFIGLGILPVAFAISGPIANLESILRGHGVGRDTILRIVPLLGLAVIVGRLGGGWLMDRVWAPAVAIGLFTFSAAASWLLVNGAASPPYVAFGVLGVGLAAGLEFDLMAFLTARYFGPRSYGGIYGTMYAFFALGSGVAPTVYGRAFDVTKSFTSIVSIGAAAMFIGGFFLLFLGPYRYQPSSQLTSTELPTGGVTTGAEA
jgi:predicted MFS family arabinose efflux permease